MWTISEMPVFGLEHWSSATGELTYPHKGTGVDLSIRELAEAVATPTGYQGEIDGTAANPMAPRRNSLMWSGMAGLGWRFRVSLAEGLASTVAQQLLPLQVAVSALAKEFRAPKFDRGISALPRIGFLVEALGALGL